ncbi:T9SS type A sorting domain-containing protein [Altibacter sp. HG106]|uniref:T9SS type A sorting domain-containing protein n=1 Tax=Altibacter sp. HG106 TaxID=3023937 RepID=UPI002350891A|nr:T9SS type A sorting domain-containing protein [Altibacter sp. HG106]MDC7993552.1 T9SS type A sorting domain-containing protein [Altibacter sp. HG106]
MKSIYILLACFLGCFSILQAQENPWHELQSKYHEGIDDPYLPVDKDTMQRQPAYVQRTATFFTTQVNVDGSGMDIVGDAANEPSIAVDPTNADRIVIGWRQFDAIASNFRQAGYGYSTDGGITFTFPGVLDPGVFRSDPVLDFDLDGNFYYNSLQDSFECDVFEITDGGVVWEAPVPARGGDKQWMRIDRSGSDSDGFNYSYWNSSFTTCPPGNFTRSTDGSETFETCIEVAGDPFWGTLAVDDSGVLYLVGVGGSSGVIVVRSLNAQNAGSSIVWETPSEVDLQGFLNAGVLVNPVGLLGQAWVDVDISSGPGAGNVYVLASVERTNGDPADVMFSRSTDGGVTFETALRLNTDAGSNAYQWMGTMSVAPNGRIDVVWLDTRDAPSGTVDSVLYYTFSDDQGTTWEPEMILSDAFDPTIGYPNQSKMGDYFDMVSTNQGAHLAWANTLNGGQDVYYTFIEPESFGLAEVPLADAVTIYPNPVTSETVIDLNFPTAQTTRISVIDLQGREVQLIHPASDLQQRTLRWEGADQLSAGVYFIRVQVGAQLLHKKVAVR